MNIASLPNILLEEGRIKHWINADYRWTRDVYSFRPKQPSLRRYPRMGS